MVNIVIFDKIILNKNKKVLSKKIVYGKILLNHTFISYERGGGK